MTGFDDLLIKLASAVGGISGFLAVLVYMQSRRDAAGAAAAYERLVMRMAEQMNKDQVQLLEVVSNNTAALHMQTESNRVLCERLGELERKVHYRRHNQSRVV